MTGPGRLSAGIDDRHAMSVANSKFGIAEPGLEFALVVAAHEQAKLLAGA